MKYGVLRNSEDMELLTSPHYKCQDRMAFMIAALERSGRYGFLAFYSALNESTEEASGHRHALMEINILGKLVVITHTTLASESLIDILFLFFLLICS